MSVPVRVHTYAGYRGEERPLAFEREGVWISIEEVLEQALEWRDARLWRRFRVRAEGRIWTLRRDEQQGLWVLDER